MAIDKRNHFPSKKFNNIIHNITINIHSDINPSHYYPYIHEIANTLANYLHHQAANNPIKAYANKQLQACHYQNPAFLSHINIPLLCASKTHPHDDSTIIREITHLIKNNFAGYFWAMNGREPIFSKSLCLISEQMHKNYLEQIQILEKEFHFKTDDLNTALFTHIEPIRITLESPEYVKAKQVIRTVMKQVQQPVTDVYGRVIGYNTVMQPTQEIAYEAINPAINSAVPNQPHVSGLFTYAQPQAVSTSYTANNNGDDNFITRINGKPVTDTREFYVKQALERLNRQAANLSKPISATQANNLNPTYNLSSAVVEPTGDSKLYSTPDSAEWRDIYKHDKVEYTASNGSMFWYHALVKCKVINDCAANKKETPDAYISNCFKCIPSIEYPEIHQKFIEDLCQASSWLEVKSVITKHAVYQTRSFRRKLELYLTREINLILSAAIGIDWKISSFYDDIEDLHNELKADYGDIYVKALERAYKKGGIFINHLSDSDVESFRSKAVDVLMPYEDLADLKDFTCVARKSLVLSVCESSGDLELNVGYNKSKQINPKEARRLYKLLDNLLNEVGGEYEVYLTTEDGIVYRVFRNELDSTLIMVYNVTYL